MKREVYYDGTCPMCTVFANTLDKSSQKGDFELVDIHKGKLLEGKTFSEMNKEIYVKGTDGKVYKNANAILNIIGSFPKLRWMEWFGKLPIINQLLHVGYNIVAQNRHLLFGGSGRLFWAKFIICFGFISSILLSTNLWLSDREYPLSPLFNWLPQTNFFWNYILLFILIALLFLSSFGKHFRYYLWGAIFVGSVLILFDQSRLQPWVYQYIVMLACLARYSWAYLDKKGKDYTLNISRFIVATIYFYSGVQKLNIEFFDKIFPWMVEPVSNLFPSSYLPAFYSFGLMVPFIEIFIGLALFSSRLRRIGIMLATTMCVFVLWTLGPLGHNWNSVVWPWNITILLLVCILFWKTNEVRLRDVFSIYKRSIGKAIIVLFGLLPATYFLNFWDAYPSWSLYSGTTNQASIYFSDDAKERLPDSLKKLVKKDNEGKTVLSVADWSFEEMNVPPYPEVRIYKNVIRDLCRKYADRPEDIILVMTGRLVWGGALSRDMDCGQLVR